MRRTGDTLGYGRMAGIGLPIAWSVGGHLLVLLAILFLYPGVPVFPLPGVVEVLLVSAPGGAAGNASPAPARVARPAVSPTAIENRLDVDSFRPARESASVRPPASADGSRIQGHTDPVPPVPVPVPIPQGAGRTAGGPDGTGSGAVGPSAGSAGFFAEGAGRALALLRSRIQERIVYPAEAVRREQEGEVLLRIRIGSGGVPREIRVAKSSGTRILDEAARRGVVRAAPLPFIPGWFEIPVRFSLR